MDFTESVPNFIATLASFSKLKLMKTYLRSKMGHSVSGEKAANKVDFDAILQLLRLENYLIDSMKRKTFFSL